MEHIYELRYLDQNKWHTFYVGRTKDLKGRKSGHKSSAKKGQTLVYNFIRQLNAVNLQWDIFSVKEFEVYDGQEDEHIYQLIMAHVKLENMKKGDSAWIARVEQNRTKIKAAGCKTLKEYNAWEIEQKRLANDEKQQKLRDEVARKDRLAKLLAKHKVEYEAEQKELRAKANDILYGLKYSEGPEEPNREPHPKAKRPYIGDYDSREEFVKARDKDVHTKLEKAQRKTAEILGQLNK